VTGRPATRAGDRILATVLFTDIVASTERAAKLGDRRWRELLGQHERLVARELTRYRGRLVKSTGDGALATFDGPARAVRSAIAMREGARAIGLELRSGVHTGECEVLENDVAGIAVHLTARVQAAARPGEVLTSGTIEDLVVGSGLQFEERGSHVLKGVPGQWPLYAVTADAERPRQKAAAPPAAMTTDRAALDDTAADPPADAGALHIDRLSSEPGHRGDAARRQTRARPWSCPDGHSGSPAFVTQSVISPVTAMAQ
jgi:class 3 adenylate cyclase